MVASLTLCFACGQPHADLILINARVYTMRWADPSPDGTPAAEAPFNETRGWEPDAEAIAIRGNRVIYVGTNTGTGPFLGPKTAVRDLEGATVLPGLVDSHVHIAELGINLARVNVVGVDSEDAAVERMVERARTVPAGDWIVGYGWDEGAWANRYPTAELLSARVPNHPVYLRGLHGFAAWANRLALERASITAETVAPTGGEILRDASGDPSGILLNRAVGLLDDALPAPTPEQRQQQIGVALDVMARGGYVSVHEAGADEPIMEALEQLERDGRLRLRVYAMLSARDDALLDTWAERGPDTGVETMLRTRSVKAYIDGALGSRGARLLEDYSDEPGRRGVSGFGYGFDRGRVGKMMERGFQVAIHAIGDAGNRETLDFFDSVATQLPATRIARHRVEHAQVLHPDDVLRFAALGVIASMEPPHAVEDMVWAEDRLGPNRIRGAYAWRTLRRARARLVFNSDLPGSDHDIFYGLHAAVTRRNRELEPTEGWLPNERVSIEEAIRAYTVWPAYASFVEAETGVIAPGRWADLTVLDLDPFVIATQDAARLLDGRILATIVAGDIVYDAPPVP